MQRPTTPTDAHSGAIANRWPNIERFLRVDDSTGHIEDNYATWSFANDRKTLPAAKKAEALEEWADFFEWRLSRRTAELATDRIKRHLVEQWTDSMAYSCRRSAAWARGDEPGRWVPQRERRPDLDAEGWAILDEIRARPGTADVAAAAVGRDT